jgi:predicted ribosomally synthesized six-cysteine peptide SCIFF
MVSLLNVNKRPRAYFSTDVCFRIGGFVMKHVKSLATRNLKESMKKGGCGECQTSCQSACKTSCTVGNQSCEQIKD